MNYGLNRSDKIIWTDHAIQRMIERDLDKKDVEAVIKNPMVIIKDNNKNTYKCFGKIYGV